jgi:class 3 adenylate cyclase
VSAPVACASCGFGNRDRAKFCGSCGASLDPATACPGCGTPNPSGQRFCDTCGHTLAQATTSTDSASGPRFGAGRYQVVRLIGEGSRKRVYLARDTVLRREVALSTLKGGPVSDTDLSRARREAEAMARLSDHPNVVPLYDVGEEDGQLFLVSQYMTGGDLQNAIAAAPGGRLGITEAVRIALQIARALERAHEQQLVHRDVKPANVWSAPDGTVKLGDFGLALALDEHRLTADTSIVGTAAYLSPEQGLGRPATVRSDLYSLGATLYELLCGTPPFSGGDMAAVISQHVSSEPVRPTVHRPEIPRALERLVLALLAKSPESRPASAAAVSAACESLLAVSGSHEARADDTTAVLDALADSPFAGRQRELRDLRAAVDHAMSGHGAAILITGEQGVGRSRLASEADTYAELRGATVLWGRCADSEGAPSYWPWIQVIRSYARTVDADVLRADLGGESAEIAQLVPEVREQIGEFDEPQPAEPSQARFRVLDAVTTFLHNVARRQPLVLVLDDIHDADLPSLELLRHLARELENTRVLVLATGVDDIEAGSVADLRGSLERTRAFSHMPLRPLTPQDVRALLEGMAGHPVVEPAEVAFVELVARESGGNPYFIDATLRHLIEIGALYRDGTHWRSDAQRLKDLPIPPTLRDAALRQIERLSATSRELLSVAAVLGREFSITVLAAVADVDPLVLADHLSEGTRSGIVAEVPDGADRYAFTHHAARETLYEQLPAARRMQLHRRVGEVLEDRYDARIEAHLAELAHHFAAAAPTGVADKAVDYSWWAGERAVQVCAFEEAVEHFQRAAKLVAYIDDAPERRCELQLALGDALWRAGREDEAKKTFLGAADLARRLGLGDAYARAALGYGCGPGGFSLESASTRELIGLLRSALTMLPTRDGVRHVRLLARLAVELHFHSGAGSADDDALSREAMAMADRLGDTRMQLLALYSRQWATMGPDDLDAKLAAGEEITRLARIVGDQEMEFAGHHLRLLALLQLADLRSVDAEIRACARLAADLRQPRYEWQLMSLRAMRALTKGRLAEGAALAHEALAVGSGDLAALTFGAHDTIVRWGRGGLGELLDGAAYFATAYPGSAWPAVQAWMLVQTSDRDAARPLYDAIVRKDVRARRRDQDWMTETAILAHTALEFDDGATGAVLHDLLSPHRDDLVPVLSGVASLGPAAAYAGFAAHAAGDLDTALEHYATAVRLEARLDAVFLSPLVRLEAARAHVSRGEQELALREIDAGIGEAEANGAGELATRLRLLRLEIAPQRTPEVFGSIAMVMASVERDKPDLEPVSAPDGTVTIIFSDIEGSTALNHKVGDRAWMQLLHLHNDIIRSSCARHGGFEVKSQGDGFMLAFASGSKAIRCAAEIHRRLEEHRRQHQDQPLRVRIGMHTGEAIRERKDFHGSNVNFAARVAQHAAADQILVSSTLRDILASTGEFEFQAQEPAELKGFPGSHQVYTVPWRTGVD